MVPAGLMANAIVPWPGPVPAPGGSNVMIVGCGPSKRVLLKIREPSIAPLDALAAEMLGAGLVARAVCDSATQAKRAEATRKTRAKGQYSTGSVTQRIIADSS